jgi:hypothetical protein
LPYPKVAWQPQENWPTLAQVCNLRATSLLLRRGWNRGAVFLRDSGPYRGGLCTHRKCALDPGRSMTVSSTEHTAGLLTALATSAIAILCIAGRSSASCARLFSVSDPGSLMNLSPHGSLDCICHATDAARENDDRRQTCRSCGNRVAVSDSSLLYETVSREQIHDLTRYLSRCARQGRSHSAAVTSVDRAAELHSSSSSRD